MKIRRDIVFDFAHGNGEAKYLADNLKRPSRGFVISFAFDALDERENLRRVKPGKVFFPDDGENECRYLSDTGLFPDVFRKSSKELPIPVQSDIFKIVPLGRDLFLLGGFFLC